MTDREDITLALATANKELGVVEEYRQRVKVLEAELVLLRAVVEAGEEYVVSINSVEDSTVCYVALKKALAAWKDQDA